MAKIQLLKQDDYWFQLKDIDDGWNECQVTSAANYLNAAGKYPYTGNWRLPDIIDDLCEGAIGKSWARQLGYPGAPREIHDILSWAINVIAGAKIDTFSVDVDINDILRDIGERRVPVILAGSFFADGHVVCATGLVTSQDEGEPFDPTKVQQVLIADPIGNYFTMRPDGSGRHYDLTTSGWEVPFTLPQLLSLLEGSDPTHKWAHRLYMI